MNNKKVIFGIIFLLLGFATIATAQVVQIYEPQNIISEDVTPHVIIEDNQLYAITEDGVLSQNIYEDGRLANLELEKCAMFDNFSHKVTDLEVNGDEVIVTTTNYLWANNSILKSEDAGKTWVDINEWDNVTYGYFTPVLKSGEISNNEELFVVIGLDLYHTLDFGKTWNKKGVPEGWYIKTHPLDSKTSIAMMEYEIDVLNNKECYISFDYWDNWQGIPYGFYDVFGVAYHYSNPNNILVIGMPIVASKDMGKTWEITKEWGADNNQFVSKADFDTRGSDRLYGTRSNVLLYSDDFGANWTELCIVGEDASDSINNFVQREDKIYAITKGFKVYQIDLSQIETSVETIGVGNENVSVSVEGNNLRINSQIEISSIEIFNISGIKLLEQRVPTADIDIANLSQGTYVARLQTVDGRSLSVKFNK